MDNNVLYNVTFEREDWGNSKIIMIIIIILGLGPKHWSTWYKGNLGTNNTTKTFVWRKLWKEADEIFLSPHKMEYNFHNVLVTPHLCFS